MKCTRATASVRSFTAAAAEQVPGGAGLQVLRLVIDAIQECNLRCKYCHPGEVWVRRHLDAEYVRGTLVAAEQHGCLEVVLSGGEITMHPQLAAILDASHVAERTVVSLVTNATLLDDELVGALRRSNVTRICVSVDGVDDETHNSARGRTRERVMDGLRRVQEADKEITVISVAHKHNFHRLAELSFALADEGLASQHHLCAPSYSGQARRYYRQLRLGWEDYFALQDEVDRIHGELATRGLHVTFNSFWPATGQRSPVTDQGRNITLVQLTEQRKDTLVHVRPDGELRLASVSWGRETVGSAVLGNVRSNDPAALLCEADRRYRSRICDSFPARWRPSTSSSLACAPTRRPPTPSSTATPIPMSSCARSRFVVWASCRCWTIALTTSCYTGSPAAPPSGRRPSGSSGTPAA
jgi:MoaA/NifB/PqqE/SkfB family radical SAM enzyme